MRVGGRWAMGELKLFLMERWVRVGERASTGLLKS
jgi:hypothetical protein